MIAKYDKAFSLLQLNVEITQHKSQRKSYKIKNNPYQFEAVCQRIYVIVVCSVHSFFKNFI